MPEHFTLHDVERAFLDGVEYGRRHHHRSVQFRVLRVQNRGESHPVMANFTLSDNQQVTLSITVEDAAGNAVTPSSPPLWTVSDGTILEVTAAADGMSADIIAVGVVGTANVVVTVANSDGTSAVGTFPIDVVTTPASQIIFTAGAPSPKGVLPTPVEPPPAPPS